MKLKLFLPLLLGVMAMGKAGAQKDTAVGLHLPISGTISYSDTALKLYDTWHYNATMAWNRIDTIHVLMLAGDTRARGKANTFQFKGYMLLSFYKGSTYLYESRKPVPAYIHIWMAYEIKKP